MTSLPFSLRQLHYFVTVVDKGSFVRAAETLNVSQPPLTQALQSMEAALGCSLLDRRTRPIRPTAAGQQLYQKASRIVQSAAEAAILLRDIASGKSGRLRVGLTDDYLSSPLLERILLRLHQMTDVDVRFHVGFTDELVEALQSNRLDCVFGNEPVDVSGDGVRSIPLSPSRIMAIIRRSDFQPIPQTLTLEDLARAPIILLDESSQTPFARQTRALIDAMVKAPPKLIRANHSVLSAKLTSLGWGAALVSEYALLNVPHDCIAVPIDHPIAQLRHSLFIAAGDNTPIISAVLQDIEAQ